MWSKLCLIEERLFRLDISLFSVGLIVVGVMGVVEMEDSGLGREAGDRHGVLLRFLGNQVRAGSRDDGQSI